MNTRPTTREGRKRARKPQRNAMQRAGYNKAEVIPQVLDMISKGVTWKEITSQEGMPTNWCFIGWCHEDPELMEAYRARRRQAAQVYAEKAISIADRLEAIRGKDEVRAAEVAIRSYQWTAERMNPAEWGQRSDAGPGIAIQIITNALEGEMVPQTITVEAQNPSNRKEVARRKAQEEEA